MNVQVPMAYGSLVDLLHPEYGNAVVGSGRAGIHGRSNSQHALSVPFGAQVVTITYVAHPNAPLLHPNTVGRYTSAETLAESVGWKVYWPIQYLVAHAPHTA